ncbi:TD and POZ domain-containing protein 4 [Trichonephila clavipes]|nr:TD and POZ domain-containing protein 4 [Trichonephila clavipes]
MDICEEKGSTFTWVIENFTFCWQKKGERILSPPFVVDTMWKTKWRLILYPKGSNTEGNFISFHLERQDSKGPENFEICFELSFLGMDGSALVSKGIFRNSFAKDGIFAENEFVKREEVFKIRRKDYLPGGVLTARCRIWNTIRKMTRDGYSLARTRIGVERRSFIWNIKLFSSFQSNMYLINSSSDGNGIITLKLFPVSRDMNETLIRVEVSVSDRTLKFLTLRLYLVDTSGNRTECLSEELAFDDNIKFAYPSSFTLSFSKEKLLESKDLYLPNDVLKLYSECAYTTGNVAQEIEKISYGCPLSMQEGNLGSDDFESASLDSIRTLKANLESSYEENLLCDVELKTKTRTFPAHKYVLSARSPVFKAMFTNDMRERNSECVNIEDMSDDTINRMLVYIYTAIVKDLKWESASQLYVAANRYEILSLKSKCSSFLKNNLSPNNACELLILSDMHQDEGLKSDVKEFILKSGSDIVNLNGWNLVLETNPELAQDILGLKQKVKVFL